MLLSETLWSMNTRQIAGSDQSVTSSHARG
jgi:hypothetical protein